MVELSYVLGAIAAFLLLAAFATWSNMFRGPILRRLDGRARLSDGQTRLGSQLLLTATGLSAVAALIAIITMMFL